jgi:drug/metabolite transporter (DMT)-like permease
VLLGFVGIVLLITPSQWIGTGQGVDLFGALALLLSAFFWSLGSVYTRDAELPDSPLLVTGMEMLAGGVGLLLAATLTGEWGRLDLSSVSQRSWIALSYLVIFGSFIGFVAYTWLLRVAPTPLVSTYAYVNPLVAILLGSLLAQEPLTPQVLISAAMILASIALINARQNRSKPLSKSPHRT